MHVYIYIYIFIVAFSCDELINHNRTRAIKITKILM